MIKLIKNLFNKKEKQCIIPDVSIMSCDLSREFHKCEIHRCSTYGCLNYEKHKKNIRDITIYFNRYCYLFYDFTFNKRSIKI